MKIKPNNPNFVKYIVDTCMQDRNSRLTEYRRLRSYFLYGSDDIKHPSPYNGIGEAIDLLVSFLFSGDTTLYSVSYPSGTLASEDYSMLQMAHTSAGVLQDYWHTSDTDLAVQQAIIWSLIFNTMFLKAKWKDASPHFYVVEPSDIGVFNDSSMEATRQEAIVHRFEQPFESFERDMENYTQQTQPDGEPYITDEECYRIIRITKERQQESSSSIDDGLENLIVTTVNNPITGQGTYQGSMEGTPITSPYEKIRKGNFIERYEAWVYDDKTKDYCVYDYVEPRLILWEGTSDDIFVKGEHPFIKVTPEPMYSYFWGKSTIFDLTDLQDWHTDRIMQIKRILNKQLQPDFATIGFGGAMDEKIDAFIFGDNNGIPFPDGTKIQPLERNFPQDVFTEINYIREMFKDRLGITEVMQGKGAEGVRSREHAALSSSLGASRIRQKSLVIEDALEQLGTLLFKMMRKYDGTVYVYRDVKGDVKKFLLGHVDDSFYVGIDAHSSSPVFMEDLRVETFELLKAQMIKPELAMDMIKFPNRQLAKAQLRMTQLESAKKEAEMLAQIPPEEKGKVIGKIIAGGEKK